MLPITSLLFPSCADLLLENITHEDQTLTLSVRSSRITVACPLCTQPSAKIHRRYTRTLADLPCMNTAVRLQVEVRRFFCGNALCPRKTFAEPFADLAAAYARRMSRQSELLRAIAVARRRQARGSSEQGMQDSSEPAYLAARASSRSCACLADPTRAWSG